MSIKELAKQGQGFDPRDRVGAVSCIVKELTEAMKFELDRSTKTCMNCCNFNATNDIDYCSKHNGKPPARIIVSGCPQHEDEIPF